MSDLSNPRQDGDRRTYLVLWLKRTQQVAQPPRTLRQIKPDLVFFGESILPEVKTRSYVQNTNTIIGTSLKQSVRFRDIDECERLLVIGTTLATYSAFR